MAFRVDQKGLSRKNQTCAAVLVGPARHLFAGAVCENQTRAVAAHVWDGVLVEEITYFGQKIVVRWLRITLNDKEPRERDLTRSDLPPQIIEHPMPSPLTIQCGNPIEANERAKMVLRAVFERTL